MTTPTDRGLSLEELRKLCKEMLAEVEDATSHGDVPDIHWWDAENVCRGLLHLTAALEVSDEEIFKAWDAKTRYVQPGVSHFRAGVRWALARIRGEEETQ